MNCLKILLGGESSTGCARVLGSAPNTTWFPQTSWIMPKHHWMWPQSKQTKYFANYEYAFSGLMFLNCCKQERQLSRLNIVKSALYAGGLRFFPGTVWPQVPVSNLSTELEIAPEHQLVCPSSTTQKLNKGISGLVCLIVLQKERCDFLYKMTHAGTKAIA